LFQLQHFLLLAMEFLDLEQGSSFSKDARPGLKKNSDPRLVVQYQYSKHVRYRRKLYGIIFMELFS
jgi:hypothetical protein